jgi:hypothetical protein
MIKPLLATQLLVLVKENGEEPNSFDGRGTCIYNIVIIAGSTFGYGGHNPIVIAGSALGHSDISTRSVAGLLSDGETVMARGLSFHA